MILRLLLLFRLVIILFFNAWCFSASKDAIAFMQILLWAALWVFADDNFWTRAKLGLLIHSFELLETAWTARIQLLWIGLSVVSFLRVVDLVHKVLEFTRVMLSDSGVHYFFINHSESIFFLYFINDSVFVSTLRLFLPAKCFIIQILVIKVRNNVWWQVTAASPVEVLLFIAILLVLLSEPYLLGNYFFFNSMLGRCAIRTNTDVHGLSIVLPSTSESFIIYICAQHLLCL